MLALVLNRAGRLDEAMVYYDRSAALPGGDSKALLNRAGILFRKQRFAEAEAAVNDSLALRPTASARIVKINFMMRRGDLEAARALLEAVPASALVDDRAAYIASYLWIWRREPEKALAVLTAATRDYFTDSWIGGIPKASIAGEAHMLAGRLDAAMAEWRSALHTIDQKLEASSNDTNLLLQRALLLASLREKQEAVRVFKLFGELSASQRDYYPEDRDLDAADFLVAVGQPEEALAKLESFTARKPENPLYSPVSRVTNLRLNPRWDPLRGTPRFEVIIKQLEAKK
jgi:tetratricopeptide (TPR) repeat protein